MIAEFRREPFSEKDHKKGPPTGRPFFITIGQNYFWMAILLTMYSLPLRTFTVYMPLARVERST